MFFKLHKIDYTISACNTGDMHVIRSTVNNAKKLLTSHDKNVEDLSICQAIQAINCRNNVLFKLSVDFYLLV